MTTDVYWISGLPFGRLAMMPRPRGGDWLEDEVRAWRIAGIDLVVSLLSSDEIDDLDLAAEEARCRAEGIAFLLFSITDRSVPASKSVALELVTKLAKMLSEGKSIAVHCRQGVGRAGLIAACVLVQVGVDPETAVQRVSAARVCAVPETAEQKRWISSYRGLQSRR